MAPDTDVKLMTQLTQPRVTIVSLLSSTNVFAAAFVQGLPARLSYSQVRGVRTTSMRQCAKPSASRPGIRPCRPASCIEEDQFVGHARF